MKFIYDNPQDISPYLLRYYYGIQLLKIYFLLLDELFQKKKSSNADNLHLHHLIYLFIKKKLFLKNKIIMNSLSAIIINFYNFLVIFLSLFYVSNSKILISILFLNIIIYLSIYSFLKNMNIK